MTKVMVTKVMMTKVVMTKVMMAKVTVTKVMMAKVRVLMIKHLFKLANIWRVSLRTRAHVMTTSTVQRALVPKTSGRRQSKRMSISMKEEKMEVTISFASGKPLEQSQSRFKSLEIGFHFKII